MAEPATDDRIDRIRRAALDNWHPHAREELESIFARLQVEIAARQAAERRVAELEENNSVLRRTLDCIG